MIVFTLIPDNQIELQQRVRIPMIVILKMLKSGKLVLLVLLILKCTITINMKYLKLL